MTGAPRHVRLGASWQDAYARCRQLAPEAFERDRVRNLWDGDWQLAGNPTGATSPVEGYDAFSIPALRGRLRSYPIETVADLLDYERATRARAPYVTLLQNRLEKLSADRG